MSYHHPWRRSICLSRRLAFGFYCSPSDLSQRQPVIIIKYPVQNLDPHKERNIRHIRHPYLHITANPNPTPGRCQVDARSTPHRLSSIVYRLSYIPCSTRRNADKSQIGASHCRRHALPENTSTAPLSEFSEGAGPKNGLLQLATSYMRPKQNTTRYASSVRLWGRFSPRPRRPTKGLKTETADLLQATCTVGSTFFLVPSVFSRKTYTANSIPHRRNPNTTTTQLAPTTIPFCTKYITCSNPIPCRYSNQQQSATISTGSSAAKMGHMTPQHHPSNTQAQRKTDALVPITSVQQNLSPCIRNNILPLVACLSTRSPNSP